MAMGVGKESSPVDTSGHQHPTFLSSVQHYPEMSAMVVPVDTSLDHPIHDQSPSQDWDEEKEVWESRDNLIVTAAFEFIMTMKRIITVMCPLRHSGSGWKIASESRLDMFSKWWTWSSSSCMRSTKTPPVHPLGGRWCAGLHLICFCSIFSTALLFIFLHPHHIRSGDLVVNCALLGGALILGILSFMNLSLFMDVAFTWEETWLASTLHWEIYQRGREAQVHFAIQHDKLLLVGLQILEMEIPTLVEK